MDDYTVDFELPAPSASGERLFDSQAILPEHRLGAAYQGRQAGRRLGPRHRSRQDPRRARALPPQEPRAGREAGARAQSLLLAGGRGRPAAALPGRDRLPLRGRRNGPRPALRSRRDPGGRAARRRGLPAPRAAERRRRARRRPSRSTTWGPGSPTTPFSSTSTRWTRPPIRRSPEAAMVPPQGLPPGGVAGDRPRGDGAPGLPRQGERHRQPRVARQQAVRRPGRGRRAARPRRSPPAAGRRRLPPGAVRRAARRRKRAGGLHAHHQRLEPRAGAARHPAAGRPRGAGHGGDGGAARVPLADRTGHRQLRFRGFDPRPGRRRPRSQLHPQRVAERRPAATSGSSAASRSSPSRRSSTR